MTSFLELEYKYLAKDVTLKEFKNLMDSLRKRHSAYKISGGSNDHYYSKKRSQGDFFRYREGKQPELTRKRKLRKGNTWARFENDLPLDPKRISKEIVDNLMKNEKYEFNFSIYKKFDIYKFKNLNFVYYSVYKINGNYVNSFIEVEINKDSMKKGVRRSHYMKMLGEGEDMMTLLGISRSDRLKQQLFDMYRKF